MVKAGKNVLVWKVIWSCRKRKQQMSKAAKSKMWVTGKLEKSISQLTMRQIRIKMAGYLPIHDGVISDHSMCYVE